MSRKHSLKFRTHILPLIGLILLLGLLIACGGTGAGQETGTGTETVAVTGSVTDGDTVPADTIESETDGETTPNTEAESRWSVDTGVFNEGKVIYEKTVETTVIPAFSDEMIGKPMSSDDVGVKSLISTDFSDSDATLDGLAALRDSARGKIIDGKLYVPYNEAEADLIGGGWTTWSPVPSASLKTNKQAQLSMDWDIYSDGSGAWMTAIWGCYVDNYSGKIPDGPGDGLWISFNEADNYISIYHPDENTWPAAWVSVPVEAGLMSGMHHLDIVCSDNYTTRIYLTAEGSDTARPVCTVLFADGMMRVYDESETLVKEGACTTDALKGSNFSLFPHAGGALIDNLDLLVGSQGEVVESTSVTARPTEGNQLGLDITDKQDLVSICYSVWFDGILGGGSEPVEDFRNITEVLAGKQEWGGETAFHYWAKPALGYYRSSDKAVIRTHMTQLYAAGVDFIILDLTNSSYGHIGTSAWTLFIDKPITALLDTIMEMRAEGLGTPYVVMWVNAGASDVDPTELPRFAELYQALYDEFYAVEKWQDCFVWWDGKPFFMVNNIPAEQFPKSDLFTCRSMKGLQGTNYAPGQWSFLDIDNRRYQAIAPDGSIEQMCVCVATQETYMSMPQAHGRNGGVFWYTHWYAAFDRHPKIVTLTWWNEWTAQQFNIDGTPHFVDNYNQEYSRDIEPMTGGHGDQYYQWLIQYIDAYKNGEECPVLVEEGYERRVELWHIKNERDERN